MAVVMSRKFVFDFQKLRRAPLSSVLNLGKIIPVTNKEIVRNSSNHGPPVDYSQFKDGYEISTNPEEWKYVERLFPLKTVPKPEPRESYPSGWQPPRDEARSLPYFLERSKNHMLPVYLEIGFRGVWRRTILRKIYGDIWLLHKEVNDYVEKATGKKFASYVNEAAMLIRFKGDVYYHVEKFLYEKGF